VRSHDLNRLLDEPGRWAQRVGAHRKYIFGKVPGLAFYREGECLIAGVMHAVAGADVRFRRCLANGAAIRGEPLPQLADAEVLEFAEGGSLTWSLGSPRWGSEPERLASTLIESWFSRSSSARRSTYTGWAGVA
jgi:hypothetical protein